MNEPAAQPALYFRTAGPLTPLQRMALVAAGLTGWRRHVGAILLGALAATALPPFDAAPVLIVSFSGLVWLEDGSADWRGAFALGWSFGFGFFVAGLYWLGAALLIDAEHFAWLIPFAVLGVPAGLAIFTGTALVITHEICRRANVGGAARIVVLAVLWTGAEWLRGHVLTGFPWNLVGYTWAGEMPGGLALVQTTSLLGIYGLSLFTVLIAALPARLGDLSVGRHWAPAVAALMLAALGGFGALRVNGDTDATMPGVTLRLVQPSIPQSLRNDPAEDPANFRLLLKLSASPAAVPPTVVIWPEGSAPPFLERNAAARRAIGANIPPGALALVGTVRTDPPPLNAEHVWNTLDAIDSNGQIVISYDKFHLVPFGEYVPLRAILPIDKITPGTIDMSSGPGPRTLSVAGVPSFSPLICYEAIFPDAVVEPGARPDWLVNITDDAWFGETSGPYQHFASARVRAVEEGLPLVRDADNGISAVVDPYGRVRQRLGLDDVGVLDASLPQKLQPTIYSQIGDWGYAGLSAVLLMLVLVPRLARRRRIDPTG